MIAEKRAESTKFTASMFKALPKPTSTITDTTCHEGSLANEELVIPKAVWERRNPGQNFADLGWRENVKPDGSVELVKWKNESGAFVRSSARKRLLDHSTILDDGANHIGDDPNKMARLFEAHVQAQQNDEAT